MMSVVFFYCKTRLVTFVAVMATYKRTQQISTLLASNVGSCCIRVGSQVQTDATTPNNIVTYSASWEGYNPYDFVNSTGRLMYETVLEGHHV